MLNPRTEDFIETVYPSLTKYLWFNFVIGSNEEAQWWNWQFTKRSTSTKSNGAAQCATHQGDNLLDKQRGEIGSCNIDFTMSMNPGS